MTLTSTPVLTDSTAAVEPVKRTLSPLNVPSSPDKYLFVIPAYTLFLSAFKTATGGFGVGPKTGIASATGEEPVVTSDTIL